jgi:branched-chain amino acid transport system permease protein
VRRVALAAALAILATVPAWVGSTYYVNIASQILFYAIFALAVNVLAGYAGLVSLGHAGLFGIAAYAAAKLMTTGYGHPVVIAGTLLVTVLAAAVFATLALRGTGLPTAGSASPTATTAFRSADDRARSGSPWPRRAASTGRRWWSS